MAKRDTDEQPEIFLGQWLEFFEMDVTEAARLAGCSQSYVSNIIANRKPNVNVLYLLRISEALSVNVNDFYRPLPRKSELRACGERVRLAAFPTEMIFLTRFHFRGKYVPVNQPTGNPVMAFVAEETRTKAINYAKRFKWGFDNAVGGSDDWRCGVNLARDLGLDDNDDPMAYDDGPCDCPECEGATARMWSKDGKLPLSIRIALNLASQPVTGVSCNA